MTDKLFLENLYLKTHQLIVKAIRVTLTESWIRGKKVKSAEHMEKVKTKSISIKDFNKKQLTLLKMSVKSLLCGPRFSLYIKI